MVAKADAMDRETLAAMIDQTLLKPTVGYRSAAVWIESNRDAGFATLCISPFLVPLAAQRLAGSCTKVCAVVGFPNGYSLTETKAEEARRLVELGAAEIDMVMNVGSSTVRTDWWSMTSPPSRSPCATPPRGRAFSR
jgi:deoxyribose-phosphate aldolase